mgnify:CR=1 FL=1
MGGSEVSHNPNIRHSRGSKGTQEMEISFPPIENSIVVLGKPTIRKSEYEPLFTFGRCIAARGRQLITTHSKGAAEAIVAGYEAEVQTRNYPLKVEYITEGSSPPDHDRVILFTDNTFIEAITKAIPDWQARHWVQIHNPKATTDAAKDFVRLCQEFGTPLKDGGTTG